jgi:hypothetical protein
VNTNVLKEHTASVFRVEVSQVGEDEIQAGQWYPLALKRNTTPEQGVNGKKAI